MKKKFNCYFCKKEFVDWISNRPCKRVFCNRKCKSEWMKTRTGENSLHWKGGKTKHINGYIFKRNGKKYDLEHRLVVEDFIGKKLNFNEVVHHINGIKNDNRIENLEIMSSFNHKKLHMIGNKRAQKYYD